MVIKDWRTWIAMGMIALFISVIVRLSAETIDSASKKVEVMEGQHEALAQRLERLETKQHPSTAKRFTNDDALELMACLDNPENKRRMCLKQLRLEHNKG